MSIYIYRYISNPSLTAVAKETFASDSVLNLGRDSRRLRFTDFVLVLSIAFLEGRARRAPTGALPCARLRASRHRSASAATPNSKDFRWGEEIRRFDFLRSWRFSFDVVAPRKASSYDRLDLSFFSPKFDLSALLVLPLTPNSGNLCGGEEIRRFYILSCCCCYKHTAYLCY